MSNSERGEKEYFVELLLQHLQIRVREADNEHVNRLQDQYVKAKAKAKELFPKIDFTIL